MTYAIERLFNNIEKDAKNEGIKEGMKEAKLEDARNLLKLGVSAEITIKATGLLEQDVLRIKKELEN